MKKNLIVALFFGASTIFGMHNKPQSRMYALQHNNNQQVSVRTVRRDIPSQARRVIDPASNSFGPLSNSSNANFFAQQPIQLDQQQRVLNGVSCPQVQQNPITIVNNGSIQNLNILTGNRLPQGISVQRYYSQDAILQDFYNAGLHNMVPQNILQQTAAQIANFRRQSQRQEQHIPQIQGAFGVTPIQIATSVQVAKPVSSANQVAFVDETFLAANYDSASDDEDGYEQESQVKPDFTGDRAIFWFENHGQESISDSDEASKSRQRPGRKSKRTITKKSFNIVDETHQVTRLQEELQKKRVEERRAEALASSQNQEALKKMNLSFILNS